MVDVQRLIHSDFVVAAKGKRPSFLGTGTMSAAQSLWVTFWMIPVASRWSSSSSIASQMANGMDLALQNFGIVSGRTWSLAWYKCTVPSSSLNTFSCVLSSNCLRLVVAVSEHVTVLIALQSSWRWSSKLRPKRLGPSPPTTMRDKGTHCSL